MNSLLRLVEGLLEKEIENVFETRQHCFGNLAVSPPGLQESLNFLKLT